MRKFICTSMSQHDPKGLPSVIFEMYYCDNDVNNNSPTLIYSKSANHR